MKLDDLMPSQLYISDIKYKKNRQWLTSPIKDYEPIPIIKIDEKIVMTDGHTRVVILSQMGLDEVLVKWENDELDLDAYKICVDWCISDGVLSPRFLYDRIISGQEFQRLWIDRCQEMHRKLKACRDNVNHNCEMNCIKASLYD